MYRYLVFAVVLVACSAKPQVAEPPLSAASVAHPTVDPLMLTNETPAVKREKCVARCPEDRSPFCQDACRVTYMDPPRTDFIREMQ